VINDFHKNLENWIFTHQNELQLLEKSLENQKKISLLSEHKGALEIVQKRLKSQIENYRIIK
jgi:hypothetical protein